MTAKSLNQKPSSLIGIDQTDTYQCFEFDQAVAGLGRFIDGKLEQINEKTLKPVYPTLDSVLKLARKDKKDKKEPKPIKKAPPPAFKRRKKKK